MKRTLAAIAVTAILVPASTALAGDYCQQGDRHPCETTTTTQVTTTTTTVPASTSTTTTVPETTTSSTPTTSTSSPATTTTVSEPTTTPPALVARWGATSACDTITGTFGEGIAQLDVWLRDPQYGDFGPAEGLVPITRSGQTLETGIAGEWIIVPVVVNGYTAVPEELTLYTERCVTSSTAPAEPPDPPDELPFTGLPVWAWALAGTASIGLGLRIVRKAREMSPAR